MTPKMLVERLRGFGYEGGVSRKEVKEFLDGDDSPELHLTDTTGKSLSLDDIWPKGITLTVSRNESEPDTVTVEDGTTEAPAEETEGYDRDRDEMSADLKAAKSRIAELEAKVGIRRSGANRVESKAATDRWNFKIPNPETAAYKRAIKTGINPATKKRPVFDDADKAEAAGAWFRLGMSEVLGKAYPQRSRDVEVVKGAVSYDNALGGTFTPPEEFRAEVIELLDEYGTARRLVPFQPIPKEGIILPRWDSDLTMSWASEGATLADQDPSTSQVSLYPKKLTGYIQITNDMLKADAVGIVDQCFRSFSRNAANKEDSAFFLGDGTSTYGGIVGLANAIGSAAVVTQDTGNTWNAIVEADLQEWLGKVAHYAWQNGPMKFTCTSSAFFEIINKLNMAKGGITARESASGNVIFQYNGFDFEWNNVMASTTATSTISAYFGAFGLGIKAGTHGSIEFAQSDQRHFDEDSIALRVIEYVDINCHDLGDSSNRGPVSALKTGS